MHITWVTWRSIKAPVMLNSTQYACLRAACAVDIFLSDFSKTISNHQYHPLKTFGTLWLRRAWNVKQWKYYIKQEWGKNVLSKLNWLVSWVPKHYTVLLKETLMQHIGKPLSFSVEHVAKFRNMFQKQSYFLVSTFEMSLYYFNQMYFVNDLQITVLFLFIFFTVPTVLKMGLY